MERATRLVADDSEQRALVEDEIKEAAMSAYREFAPLGKILAATEPR